MTDLERAIYDAGRAVGAQEERMKLNELKEAERRSAAEMRERAAARLRQAGRDCESRWPGVTIDQDIGDFAADIVSALLLTPEEPT